MPAEAIAEPWAAMAEALAARLAESGAELTVLGARDELAVGLAEGTSAADGSAPPAVSVPDGAGSAAGDAVPVYLYGHQAIVGPAASAACPRCLVRRWQAVRSGPLREALELGDETKAVGEPPWAVPFLADGLAALIAARRQRGLDRPAAGVRPVAQLLDLETLRVSGFPVLPDAECPRCDQRVPDTAEGARIELAARPKRAPADFRLRGIEAYALPLAAFVNPVSGMLGPSVVPDLVSASTSSTVGCFTLRSGDYLRETFWGGHTASYGTSTAVGLLEGLERLAGMRARGKRTGVVASLAELGPSTEPGGQALDPRTCGLYAPEFHRDQPGVRPFAPDRPIPWVWGWSLRDERPILVPEILTYYHAPGGLENRFVQESSNGCASGGSLEEAIYFGLMEAVERDAFLLAWYGRLALPELDGRSSTRPETRALIDRLAMYGYRARFFDTRISFPVPVVTAVAERIDGGLGRMCFGAGASLDPEAALWAGLCEIATDAVNLRRRTVREEHRLRAMAEDFDQVQVLHDHPLLYGLPEMARHADFLLRAAPSGPPEPLSRLAEGSIAPATDLREDLRACVGALGAAGFDVVVVDQTMPEQREFGLHTACVLVPGLLPIDFGHRRQRALTMPRLRTAPREAGLRDRDLLPAEFNPAPHPFP